MKKLLSAITALSVIASAAVLPMSAQAGTDSVTERTKAFPTAEGGGMYSEGARAALDEGLSMEVYHVTNLNDSGEGSFRDAVSKSNRIIVFDVSGNIDLESRIIISKDNLTILGQTAPGDGIVIRGYNVKVSASNVIVRYIRFRVGAHLADGSLTKSQDGFEIGIGSHDVIVDHCSVSWGTDENLSVYGIENVTVQWSIIAEALNQSVHDKGEHSYAGIWGGVNLSMHHNIIATHKSRNPKIGTSETVSMTEGYNDDDTLVDYRNNIIYNWGDKAGYGAENGANVNIVNNYYRPGPATPSNKSARIFEISAGNKYQSGWGSTIYADGNYIDADTDDAALVNADNWQVDAGTGVYTADGVSIYKKLDEPNTTYIDDYPITTTTAQNAYDEVMANAGARLPKLDAVDTRILANVADSTAPDGSSGSVGLIDDPSDTIPQDAEQTGTDDDGNPIYTDSDGIRYDFRGYPIIDSVSRGADYDSDGDGIADEWEERAGLNPDNPYDSLNLTADGLTWLEVYAEEGITSSAADTAVEYSCSDEVITTDSDVTLTAEFDNAQSVEFWSDDTLLGVGAANTAAYYSDGAVYAPDSDGATAYAAAYDESGILTQIKSADVADGKADTGAVSGASVRVFVWDGMTPVTGSSYTLTTKLPAGMSTVTAKAYYADGSTAVAQSAVLGAVSDTAIAAGDSIDFDTSAYDEFTVVSQIAPSNLVSGASSYIYIGGVKLELRCLDDYSFAVYLDGSKKTDDLEEISWYKLIKTADGISAYIGKNVGEWTQLGTVSADSADTAGVGVSGSYTVTQFADTRVITEKTSPEVSIESIADGDRIGFNDSVTVKITPDNGAAVSYAAVYFNGELVSSVSTDITDEQTIEIPMSFTSIDEGTLSVSAVDDNLCIGEDSREVYISADPAPWELADIGDVSRKTYTSVTSDYTYKINAPSGYIGGTSDSFGYLYQQFTGDNRIYYRSRMQSGSQFGIMLRSSLDEDSAAIFFGGEYNEGSENALSYDLKSRTAAGGSMSLDYTLAETGQNMYFIVEKAGDTLNIYKSTNGSTVFVDKELLYTADCSMLGDTYYMGFASVYGGTDSNPPDAGWVSMDNCSGDNEYAWSFDYGLDWMWQIQESGVLAPAWSNTEIASNATGKMEIAPDSDYESDRYIFHEYITDDSLYPQMSADVLVSGDEPILNVYFQTGSADSAYKVEIKDGAAYVGDEQICTVNSSEWYSIDIRSDISEDAEEYALITISQNGTAIGEAEAQQVTGTEFRTQTNTEKKTAVTKAVYFEAGSDGSGAYYIDNVRVTANAPSVNVTKTTSWYTFEGLDDQTTSETVTLNGTTSNGGTELSGEQMTISAGAIISSSSKTVSGVSFSKKMRIKTTKGQMTVPVKTGSQVTVYAASASSSSERILYINGEEYPLTAAVASVYTHTGDDGSIVIYAGDNIDVYGVSVVTTAVE